MTTSVANSSVCKILSLSWLTGPIFDKELRVSSRRKRNYLLRFAYIILLSIFILSVWFSIIGIRNSGSAVYISSRLSQAGRQVIIMIAWFQFIACQLIAVVMLSSSISDEIHAGTLGVLMTTPISSFQIVVGKLLSKLLQLILLLAISLPLLAIVRIFGGVSWDYVVSSVCITLTATLLAGALSFLLSIAYRHAYTVILVTMAVYMLFFGALTGLFNMLAVKRMFVFDRQVTHESFRSIRSLECEVHSKRSPELLLMASALSAHTGCNRRITCRIRLAGQKGLHGGYVQFGNKTALAEIFRTSARPHFLRSRLRIHRRHYNTG
jgi:ABC-type transport system involved in multi-copper enzyme maturation permease subunit